MWANVTKDSLQKQGALENPLLQVPSPGPVASTGQPVSWNPGITFLILQPEGLTDICLIILSKKPSGR